MDTLSNPEKRRLFDSVDPNVDDSVPDPVADDEFLDAWAPVFDREARFNNRKDPAPALGTMDAPKAEVERFYDFWYNFDSWRSFEYLDKEANEGSDSRDEKRYAERKNKAERARRKKEDNTRLRELVDTALARDPRIRRFKQEDKAARDAKKKGKVAASPAQQRAEDEKKRKEAEEAAKVEQAAKDAADKADRDAAKKQREVRSSGLH
jgi:DnaJ family protein C protein 2